ncbi:MAG: alpha-1,2-fucosyltransferase [Bacteroidota bacterium]
MIVIKIIGGLGNQMFQYAAAKAISIEKRQKMFLDVDSFNSYALHKYGLHNFALRASIFKKPSNFKKGIIKFFGNKQKYKEVDLGFNSNFFYLKGNPLILDGYFQSEKYFIKYEKEIRQDFKIVSTLKPITLKTIDFIKGVNAVSIHFRRGDYVGNTLHETDKTEYYKKAMKIIESKLESPVYFLFSDDIPWVKENFITNFETHYIDFNDFESNYEDLKLMSSCKHNIIANSSFSWWGAWLNSNPDKIVIAPQKWFGDETLNYQDIIPENWIKI